MNTTSMEPWPDSVESRTKSQNRRIQAIQRWACYNTQELAWLYHWAVCNVARVSDFDARKPFEREAEVIFKIGHYLFADAWTAELHKITDWPTPVSQISGTKKTTSYEGVEGG